MPNSKPLKTPTTTLMNIEREISPMVTIAHSIEVSSTTINDATELLSRLNQYNDRITEEKEKVTKPLNEALKAERARWKPLESLYQGAISAIRAKLSTYQTEETKRLKEEEAKIAARIGEGKGHLKIETAVSKIDNLDKPAARVTSSSGMIKFRTDKVLKITDHAIIPREYLIPDEKRLLLDLKAGNTIPGVEIEEIQTPINFR